MRDLTKYHGIIPAFYACYDDDGNVSAERTKKFAEYLLNKGVKGLYVCGSSGECIYQSKEERKLILESVMEVARQKTAITSLATVMSKPSSRGTPCILPPKPSTILRSCLSFISTQRCHVIRLGSILSAFP